MTESPQGAKKEAPQGAKAEAARAEATKKPKLLTWRKLKLELPAELPATILFDFTMLEVGGEDALPVYRLLHSIVGGEQFVAIRNLLASAEETEGAVDDLFGKIFEKYGISLGE